MIVHLPNNSECISSRYAVPAHLFLTSNASVLGWAYQQTNELCSLAAVVCGILGNGQVKVGMESADNQLAGPAEVRPVWQVNTVSEEH